MNTFQLVIFIIVFAGSFFLQTNLVGASQAVETYDLNHITTKLTRAPLHDSYSDPKLVLSQEHIHYANISVEQLNNYSNYMSTEEFSERLMSEIIIPVGAFEPRKNKLVFEQMSQEDLELFLKTKRYYLTKIASLIIKVTKNKVSQKIINDMLIKFNDEFFMKAQELIGDRAIAINLGIFTSMGIALPNSWVKMLKSIRPFTKLTSKLGFYYYLGTGLTVYKIREGNKSRYKARPTIDFRYAQKVDAPFLNISTGFTGSITLEKPKAKLIQLSDFLILPVLKMYHGGDQLGLNWTRSILFVPGGSIVMTVSGQSIRVNPLQIIPSAAKTLKTMVTQEEKVNLREALRHCRSLFKSAK